MHHTHHSHLITCNGIDDEDQVEDAFLYLNGTNWKKDLERHRNEDPFDDFNVEEDEAKSKDEQTVMSISDDSASEGTKRGNSGRYSGDGDDDGGGGDDDEDDDDDDDDDVDEDISFLAFRIRPLKENGLKTFTNGYTQDGSRHEEQIGGAAAGGGKLFHKGFVVVELREVTTFVEAKLSRMMKFENLR